MYCSGGYGERRERGEKEKWHPFYSESAGGKRERERERDKMMGAGSARHKKGAGLLCLSSRLCISK